VLFVVELSDRADGLLVGQVAPVQVYLLEGQNFLLLQLNRPGPVLDKPRFFLFDELALFLELRLQGFNRLLVHFALRFHRVSLSLLARSHLVTLLFDFVLQDLLRPHYFENPFLR